MNETARQGDGWLERLDPFRVGRFLLRRRVRLTVAWVVAVLSTANMAHRAWVSFDKEGRRDGNNGHVSIDFGGQWLSARMVAEGRGDRLFDLRELRAAAERAYPAEDGVPGEGRDSDGLAGSLVTADPQPEDGRRLGGALYPPTQAVLFAPLALLPPRTAYRVVQAANLLLAWLIAGLLQRLSRGRTWAPVTVVVLFLFPGYSAALDLGQNAILSLALLALGWTLQSEGRPVPGGVCWGLLAFKPVWAAAFFLAPLLTRRWRFAAAMLLTGVGLAALTLPFVGRQAWLDWLAVGRTANAVYDRDRNWVHLSRDLQGLPRRVLLRFRPGQPTEYPYGKTLPNVVGRSLLATALLGTAVVAWLRRRRPTADDGPAAAFVLLGAWLSCLHFMYYDVLLAALPVGLLFTEPARYFRLRFLRGRDAALAPELAPYYQPSGIDEQPPPLPLLPDGLRRRWVRNPLPPTLLLLLISVPGLIMRCDEKNWGQPVDTLLLAWLWVWCGWVWLRQGDNGAPGP